MRNGKRSRLIDAREFCRGEESPAGGAAIGGTKPSVVRAWSDAGQGGCNGCDTANDVT